MSEQAAVDDALIARLVHRYCDAVCTGDTDAWIDTWSDDAVWNIGRGPVVGREAIRSAYESAMDLFESVNQVSLNGGCDLDRAMGTGSGRWYMSEYALSKSAHRVFYLGYYDDRYVRNAAGEWKFAARTLSWLYQGPPDLSGSFGPPPGYDYE